MALPRVSVGNRSEIDPPARVKEQEAKKPQKNRLTKTVSILVATAHGILNKV